MCHTGHAKKKYEIVRIVYSMHSRTREKLSYRLRFVREIESSEKKGRLTER